MGRYELLACFLWLSISGRQSIVRDSLCFDEQAIADALDANKTLKVLNISGNAIEDKELRKKCRSRRA